RHPDARKIIANIESAVKKLFFILNPLRVKSTFFFGLTTESTKSANLLQLYSELSFERGILVAAEQRFSMRKDDSTTDQI
uniref:hypothetical protein n=1 Tax=Mesotoga prima TaxID=1184387 RepID=UPI002FD9FAEA